MALGRTPHPPVDIARKVRPDMRFLHVNVFSEVPYGGNSLAVFPDATGLGPAQMLRITQELRHFESVFLFPWKGEAGPGFQARVFDLSEELDFAGHPVIGAAAVLHHLAGLGRPVDWTLELKARTVRVKVRQDGRSYEGVLDQGAASFLGQPEIEGLASWFDLEARDLHPDLRPQVVLPASGTSSCPSAGGCWTGPASASISLSPSVRWARSSPTCSTPTHWKAGTGTTTAFWRTSPRAARPAASPPICAGTNG